MPLYEFSCEICGGTEELLQSHGEPAPIVCLECGAAESMKRNFGAKKPEVKK